MHGTAAQERFRFYQGLAEKHPQAYQSRSPCAPAKPGFEEIIHPIEARLYQAMMLHSRGDLKQALALYADLLTVAPDFFLIWERLRDLCSMAGLDKDAQLCGQKAIELYPGSLRLANG